MDYFYCPPEKISATSLIIDGEEFAHLVHVMRAREGDEIRVVDGKGTAYNVRLGEIKKKMVQATIHHTDQGHNEPMLHVTLAVGVLKNPSKFDFLAEKATELGVRRIVPIRTERTIPQHSKSDRWQKLALAAMKQCGRSYLPVVEELVDLEEFLRDVDASATKLIAHERRLDGAYYAPLRSQERGEVTVLIGPEGGFSDDEVRGANARGFVPVYLGERRLRTETAAVLVCGMLLPPPLAGES